MTYIPMTKANALKLFRDQLAACNFPRGDAIMRREEWNNFTDSLCKAKLITSKQYDTWTNPF